MIINYNFDFLHHTKIRFGAGECANVGEEVLALGKRPMIVCDRMIRETGLVAKVEDALKKAGIEYSVFDGVQPNPTDILVEGAAEYAKSEGVDVLIGIGGGGPMDVAKAVAALMTNGRTCAHWAEPDVSLEHDPIPVICIPTTSGTGSEVTYEAVITNTRTKVKMSFSDGVRMAPRVALVDPSLTLSVPPLVTASTGMDALTHAIEAYTCTWSKPITDALALYAIDRIVGSIEEATRNGGNETARRDMMLGSLMAGVAFTNSFLGAVHSLSETIGGVYGTPHGIANAIFLPYVTEFNMAADYEKHAILAQHLGIDTLGLSDQEAAEKGVAKLYEMNRILGIPKLRDCKGVDPKDFDDLADRCMVHICQPANAMPITKQDFLELLEKAYNA